MVNMQVCRICLVKDLGTMHSIAGTPLEDIYQSLTGMPFETKDFRPLQVCYICHGRLMSCYRLKLNCLRSEELFSQMMISNVATPQLIQHMPRMSLSIRSALTCNVPEAQANMKSHIKQEPVEYSDAVEVKQEYVEDVDDWNIEHDEAECSIPSTETGEIYVLEVSLEDCGTSDPVAKKPKLASLIENTQIAITTKLDVEETVVRNTEEENIVETTERAIGKKTPITDKHIENEIVGISGGVHSERKPYICEVCKICFNVKSSLLRHTRIHSDEKPYMCDMCEKCFSQKSNLIRHVSIHTGEKPYTCDVCKKCFSQKGNLITHKRIHTGEKPYACDVCEKCFSQKSELITHKRIHTGEKPYTCDVCEKCFTKKSDLVRHNRIHLREEPFTCNVCEKCFHRKSDLIKHSRMHTGEKPNMCEICEKCFRQKRHLIIHTRKHTGEKPYKCDVCEKCFSQKGNLMTHTRIHTGRKPYTCDVCEKRFSQKSNLIKHTRIHTGTLSTSILS